MRRKQWREELLLRAVAFDAGEFGTDAADPNKLGFKGLAGSMETNGGVARGNSGPGREGFQALAREVDAAENLAVGGLDGGKDLVDATADDLLSLSVGCGFGCEVVCPLLESAVFGGTVAIVIDDGVAQDAIEPGDGRLFTAQDVGVFDGADIGALDDVFRDRGGVDSSLHKMEEVISLLNEAVNGFYLHGAFPHRERRWRTVPAAATLIS
jgi:hypothetical protein